MMRTSGWCSQTAMKGNGGGKLFFTVISLYQKMSRFSVLSLEVFESDNSELYLSSVS